MLASTWCDWLKFRQHLWFVDVDNVKIYEALGCITYKDKVAKGDLYEAT